MTPGRRRLAILATLAVAVLAVILATRLPSPEDKSSELPAPATTPAATAPSGSLAAAGIKARRLSELRDPVDDATAAENDRAWDCSLESLPVYATFDDKTGSAQLAGIADRLAASGHAEQVLAAAILSESIANGAVDALTERAMALDPRHPMVMWRAASLCTRSATAGACRDPVLQQRIRETHRDNGAYWSMVANQQLRNGSDSSALASLQRAATAAQMDQHIVQQALLVERGLSSVGDLGSAERAIVAVFLAPLAGDLNDLFTACRERPTADAVWAQACLDWGRRLSSESTSAMHRLFGYIVQANVLQQVDPSADLASINDARQALREQMNVISEDWMMLMLVDHQFSAQFVDQFAANGEIAALQFAEREITRLQADPEYDPCTLAGASGAAGKSTADIMRPAP